MTPLLQSLALAMELVPQWLALVMALLAQSLAPMLKSLFSDLLRDRFRDLFCWPLLMSTASTTRQGAGGDKPLINACTRNSGTSSTG